MNKQDRLWAIILAAGEGTRLAPLTERLYGERLPKQFAVLAGDRSLLQVTVERLLPLVAPSRMVVVVPLAYEGLARKQIADYPGARAVAQPANRGTGPGDPRGPTRPPGRSDRQTCSPSPIPLTKPRAACGPAP